MRPRACLAVAALVLASGCLGFGPARTRPPDASWRPSLLAHVVDPGGGTPDAEARLRAAAAALAGERWLDAVILAGDAGPDPAEAAAALGATGRPTWLARPDAGDAGATWIPIRGLRLLAPRVLPGSEGGFPPAAADWLRGALAAAHGEMGLVILPVPLEAAGGEGAAPRAGATALAYVCEASPRAKALLVPGPGKVERRGGLLHIETPPIAAGRIRLLAVDGARLRTWLRPVDPRSADEPVAELDLR